MVLGKWCLRYRIDAGDRIDEISPGWDDFADGNEAPSLTPAAVLGEPLWRFIAGDEVQLLYRRLLERIRETGLPVTVPFRCDAPAMRRFMEVRIEPAADFAVDFTTTLLREEWRPGIAFLATEILRGDPSLTSCSWCKQLEIPLPGWVDAEEALVRFPVLTSPIPPRIVHGVCPDCRGDFERQLRDLDAEPQSSV